MQKMPQETLRENPQGQASSQMAMQRQGSKVILCADSESLLHPALLGLEDEKLDSAAWITVFSDASQARESVRSEQGPLEVWVAGSDQIEAINLAAALKRDRPDAVVSLISFETNGSLASRAKSAGVDGVLDRVSFAARYKAEKGRFTFRDPDDSSRAFRGSNGKSGAFGDCSGETGRVQSESGQDGMSRASAVGGIRAGIFEASVVCVTRG